MADRIRPLLRRTLRVSTTDNRIFLGTFAGTDQPLNIVLVNTEEYRLVPARTAGLYSIGEETDTLKLETPDGRFVGQVLIPWKMVVKIEADVGDVTLDMGYEDMEYTYELPLRIGALCILADVYLTKRIGVYLRH